jgi:uncharacterized protein
MKPFQVGVADLMHRPGARRTESLTGPTAAMTVAATLVPEGSTLVLEAKLEPVSNGILTTGWAEVSWTSECRRCEIAVAGTTRAEFREQFEPHTNAEADEELDTYPLVQDRIDLELVAREAILLDLPLAPLCREECAGLCPTCGADLNEGACECVPVAADPRWAALDALRLEE